MSRVSTTKAKKKSTKIIAHQSVGMSILPETGQEMARGNILNMQAILSTELVFQKVTAF